MVKDPNDPQDEPSLPSAQEETPSTSLAVVEKGVDDVLPETTRVPLDELANPTGVSLLLGLVREGKVKERAQSAEIVHLRRENMELRDLAARSDQEQKTRWAGPVVMTVGGVLLGAIAWPVPIGIAALITAVGGGLVAVGAYMSSKSDPSKKG